MIEDLAYVIGATLANRRADEGVQLYVRTHNLSGPRLAEGPVLPDLLLLKGLWTCPV